MSDESDHLCSYVQTGSEAEFTAVVQRFLPLVYSSALRRVYGDTHRAEDVTQLVFVALARNARSLSRHPDLAGWLFTTTRFLAAKAQRTERRRYSREREAVMNHQTSTDDVHCEASVPLHELLDDLIADLKQVDRQVILLRFHQGLRLAEVGAQIGATENAIQKRLDRALDQLREKLSRRGVTSTVAVLTLALEQQATAAVPAGLAAASTHAALAWKASGLGSFAISSFMSLSKLQLAASALVLGGSVGLVWQHRENSRLQAALHQQSALAQTQTAAFQRQLEAQTKRSAAVEADLAGLLKAVQSTSRESSPAPASARTASNIAQAALDRAKQLRREGRTSEELEECLKAYHELRAQRPFPTESQMMVGYIVAMGRNFPSALASLRTLRDTAQAEFIRDSSSLDLGSETAWLNLRLGDGLLNLAIYDGQPSDSPLRRTIGVTAQDAFAEAYRYADALSYKTYGTMLNELDFNIKQAERNSGRNPNDVQEFREQVAKRTAISIETLTGAGHPQEARQLTEKLLAFDNSAPTQALIRQHTERANQPPAPKPPFN